MIQDEKDLRRLMHTVEVPVTGGGTQDVVRVARRRQKVRRVAWSVAAGVAGVSVVGSALALQPGPQTGPPAGPGPRPTESPSVAPTSPDPSEQPSATADSSAPVPDPTVLVVGSSAGAVIGTVAAGSTEFQVTRVVEPPFTPAAAVQAAVTSGTDPVACVVWAKARNSAEWELGVESRLVCYAPGSTKGIDVPEAGNDPYAVALRPDGSAIAWTDSEFEWNMRLTVASLDGVDVDRPRARLLDASRPWGRGFDSFSGLGVDHLAFAGDTDQLVVSVSEQSDDAPGLVVVDVNASGSWYDRDAVLRPPHPERQNVLDRYRNAVSAGPGWATARLSSNWVEAEYTNPPGDRGVLVDLATGEVLETLVMPSEGRDVLMLFRTAAGLVYSTQAPGGKDRVDYIRWDGETRGSPLSGLPSGARLLAAS